MTAMLFNVRMDIYEIRKANLLALMEQHKDSDGKKTDSMFATAIGTGPSHLSQLKTGKTKIGDDVARRIEELLKLSHGWMDQIHRASSSNISVNDEIKLLAEAIARQPSERLEIIKGALKLVGVNIPLPNEQLTTTEPGALVVTDPIEKELINTFRHATPLGKKLFDLALDSAGTDDAEGEVKAKKKN